MNDILKQENRSLYIMIAALSAIGLWLGTNKNVFRILAIILLVCFLIMWLNKPKYLLTQYKITAFPPTPYEKQSPIAGEITDTQYLKRNGANQWLPTAKGASLVGVITGYFLITALRRQNPEMGYSLVPYREEAFIYEVQTGEKLF